MKTPLKLGLLLFVLGQPAFALSLSEAMSALGDAKAAGLLGEQPDGYLGVIRGDGQATAIASQINQARRAEYQRLANQNGIALRDVETIAGQKAIDKTPPGQFVWQGGRWRQK